MTKTPQMAPLAGMTPFGLPATEKDVLAGQEVDQALIDGVPPVSWTQRALADYRARRDGRRGDAPLPAGGLFDEVERKQGELF